MRIVRLLLILYLCLFALTACKPSAPRASAISYFEVVGDQAKRVSVITAMLAKFSTLPTAMIDAQFVEEKIGDSELGPADYRTFTLIEIAPDDVATWQGILTPLAHPPSYAAPSQPYEWWVGEDAFATLVFYEPAPLTQHLNGWIALDPQQGKIYVFSFTT